MKTIKQFPLHPFISKMGKRLRFGSPHIRFPAFVASFYTYIEKNTYFPGAKLLKYRLPAAVAGAKLAAGTPMMNGSDEEIHNKKQPPLFYSKREK
jgi:hypothetical protein